MYLLMYRYCVHQQSHRASEYSVDSNNCPYSCPSFLYNFAGDSVELQYSWS